LLFKFEPTGEFKISRQIDYFEFNIVIF
jgi:hypothetical protein